MHIKLLRVLFRLSLLLDQHKKAYDTLCLRFESFGAPTQPLNGVGAEFFLLYQQDLPQKSTQLFLCLI